jgi:hypothetical protein
MGFLIALTGYCDNREALHSMAQGKHGAAWHSVPAHYVVCVDVGLYVVCVDVGLLAGLCVCWH